MQDLANTKVSKIVAKNFKTAKVFSAYGIDFCCNGGIPLSDACAQKSVNLQEVVAQLEVALAQPQSVDYQAMDMSALADHIVSVHHGYVNQTMPILRAYLDKLARVHGERHPELHQIRDLFEETVGNLTMHMKKEELILFPYIQAMCRALENGTELPSSHFGHINNPIHMMQDEHEVEGARLREIAAITNNYTCPPDGCQTYRVAFAVLDEFEKDLHTHIHLENNILFPRALELFAQMQGQAVA
ncbi:MAG: iron-sulfur cluster repair di-iron protein [Bacteroidetes bacterium]|jgi:regulator of cell morphogenesis and NO signaling|nr:iron-sulfur cluster repair di-iron protein [Bacteroidota bacterium]